MHAFEKDVCPKASAPAVPLYEEAPVCKSLMEIVPCFRPMFQKRSYRKYVHLED